LDDVAKDGLGVVGVLAEALREAKKPLLRSYLASSCTWCSARDAWCTSSHKVV
jgi:hypothetical protein